MDGLYKLFPDEFKYYGIGMPSLIPLPWDGQKIIESGKPEINEDCTKINNIYPRFLTMLYSFLAEE